MKKKGKKTRLTEKKSRSEKQVNKKGKKVGKLAGQLIPAGSCLL